MCLGNEMSDQTPQRKINLRKYSRPKPSRNPQSPANGPERVLHQSPIPNELISQTPPPSPTRPSTAESFKNIYTNVKNKSSFSGNLAAIANQLPSYRSARRYKPY